MKKNYLLIFVCSILANAVFAQSLTSLKVSDEVALLSTIVPGFQPTQYTYTVEYWFDYARTPVIEAIAVDGSTVKSITQPGSLASVTSAIGTVVVGKDGESDVTYTINFIKSDDYIDGCLLVNGTTHGGPVITKAALGLGTVNASDNNGICIGHGGFRNNNNSNLVYKTPALSNGAGVLTFYWKKYTTSTDGTEVPTKFHVMKSSSGTVMNDTLWTVTVSNPDNVPDEWTKVEIPVNVNSQWARVGFCTTGRPSSGTYRRYFIFDDIRITPYGVTTLSNSNINDDFKVRTYAVGKEIVIESDNISDYQIYTITGMLIHSGFLAGKEFVNVKTGGIYFVKVGKSTKKVIVL